MTIPDRSYISFAVSRR